jgi:hypothetical protein
VMIVGQPHQGEVRQLAVDLSEADAHQSPLRLSKTDNRLRLASKKFANREGLAEYLHLG